MTQHHGWTSPFKERPSADILVFLNDVNDPSRQFRHMSAIVESIIDSAATDLLAGQTSMHDLLVAAKPVSPAPLDVITVRAPGSLRASDQRFVVIEHLSTTGHNDRIKRPVTEAVPLFWRFVIQQYGIEPRSTPE